MTELLQRPSWWAWAAVLPSVAVSLTACGGYEAPRVPTGDHPTDTEQSKLLETVEYPPPPAKVEETGKAPSAECRWRDGYWEWRGRRWEWVDGAWIVPPEDCVFAHRVIMVWLAEREGSQLYYGKPRWYRARGEERAAEGEAQAAEPTDTCVEPAPCKPPTGDEP